jgi:hypothetical protein
LEIAIIAKKAETMSGQVKRQGNAWTVFWLNWNCSHEIHLRRSDCKQALLHGDPLPSQFVASILSFGAGRTGYWYMTTPLHIALCLTKRSWKNNSSPFCHTLHTHLISHRAISFSFPAWKKGYVGVDFSWPRRSSLPHGKPYETFLQITFSGVSTSYTNVVRLA